MDFWTRLLKDRPELSVDPGIRGSWPFQVFVLLLMICYLLTLYVLSSF